jgi:hypothetical protein
MAQPAAGPLGGEADRYAPAPLPYLVLRPTRLREMWRRRRWWLAPLYLLLALLTWPQFHQGLLFYVLWLPQLAATALLFIWAVLLPQLLKIELGEGWVAYTNGLHRRHQFPVASLSQAVERQVNFWAKPNSPKHLPPTLPGSDRYLRLYFLYQQKRLCFSVVLGSWTKDDISALLQHCGLTPTGQGKMISTYDFDQQYPRVLSGWLMFCTTRPWRYYSVIVGSALLVALASGIWGWLHG